MCTVCLRDVIDQDKYMLLVKRNRFFLKKKLTVVGVVQVGL
jgi:hypothetical protein